jgi:phenylacetate-CoA ligase
VHLSEARVAEPFDKLDTFTADELRQWWTRRIRSVLKIAAAELPLYAKLFTRAGFDPANFRKLDDLQAVPILTKTDVLAAQTQSGSNQIGIERGLGHRAGVTLSLSSGTSGTTYIAHTPRWRRLQGLSASRAHWWAGLRRGGSLVLSAPAWHSYAAIQPFVAEYFGMRCVVVSGTYLPRFADRIVDAIQHFRPKFVTMFLPMVFSILATARRLGISGSQLFASVESLVVTGAPITPGMRSHLSVLTGVGRVAEIAGTSENLLAVDCPRAEGLHVVPDTCYAEVLDPQTQRPLADGEPGMMVSTALIAAGSLFIRYDAGDIGILHHEPCRCGLAAPRIKIFGRWENRFRLGARMMLPYDVQLALEEEVPELNGATCVIGREALALNRLRLLLIEPEQSASSLIEAARSKLERRFEVPVEVVAVRELPLRFKGVPPILSESEVAAES